MLKEKPWWLKIFVPRNAWVTIYPNIYYPDSDNPALEHEIVVHENVHLKQQSEYGLFKWMWRYFTNKAFRLDQEAKAMAVEILARPVQSREDYIKYYAGNLSGSFYHHAAKSFEIAADKIRAEIAIIELTAS
jgi:hypothetical protein